MPVTTVRAPGNPAHLMHVKPVTRRIRITRGGKVLAESAAALRVMETGKDVYDPMIYLPRADLADGLALVDGKSTHCPLKGDCSYFALDGEDVAWSYDRPIAEADIIRDLVAFYPDKVVVEEIGASVG